MISILNGVISAIKTYDKDSESFDMDACKSLKNILLQFGELKTSGDIGLIEIFGVDKFIYNKDLRDLIKMFPNESISALCYVVICLNDIEKLAKLLNVKFKDKSDFSPIGVYNNSTRSLAYPFISVISVLKKIASPDLDYIATKFLMRELNVNNYNIRAFKKNGYLPKEKYEFYEVYARPYMDILKTKMASAVIFEDILETYEIEYSDVSYAIHCGIIPFLYRESGLMRTTYFDPDDLDECLSELTEDWTYWFKGKILKHFDVPKNKIPDSCTKKSIKVGNKVALELYNYKDISSLFKDISVSTQERVSEGYIYTTKDVAVMTERPRYCITTDVNTVKLKGKKINGIWYFKKDEIEKYAKRFGIELNWTDK